MNNNSSVFQDPAFATNKNLPIHRWVPWIAGFSSCFVRDTLLQCIREPGIVLDPFAGVGTTLIEAVLLGHGVIGFDINPYAALSCRLKLNASHIDSDLFRGEIERFQVFYHDAMSNGYIPLSSYPAGFKTRAPFYSTTILRKVLIVRDFTRTIPHESIRSLFDLAFASTMVSYSNYSYEPSLGRRVSADKSEIDDFPVEQAIVTKLSHMVDDIVWLQDTMTGRVVQAKVFQDSWFRYTCYLAPSQVDVIITSPPYLNNYHYNRNTRPHLYWLGYAQKPQDFTTLEQENFGMFWQTVRSSARLDLNFTLPGSDLAERLEHLRQLNPDRGIYGGNGWANYAVVYFNDCYRFAKSVLDVLRPGGQAFVVLGNSILQGVVIPTDHYFAQIAAMVGLDVVCIDVPRSTRVGNSIIQSDVRVGTLRSKQQLYEAVIHLRKR